MYNDNLDGIFISSKYNMILICKHKIMQNK